MTVLQAIVLGAVQGVTEFLPISSDGHLILAPAALGWERFGLGFDVLLHAGTLAATVAYFRADVVRLAAALFSRDPARSADRRTVILIILATVPSVILALAAEPLVESVETLPMTRQVEITAWFLLLTSATLAAAEFLSRRMRRTGEVSLARAIAIGTAQGFAVAPGLSRSGVTIATGVGSGLEREAAARFSFLLSIPIVFAATAKKGLDALGGSAELPGVLPSLVGVATTLVVGYAAIGWLLPYVRRHTLYPFAAYTLVLGGGILVWRLLGT